MFKSLKLSVKLPVLIVAFCIIVGAIVGFESYYKARQSLIEQEKEKLRAITNQKKNELEKYFDSILQDLQFNSANPYVFYALESFKGGWNDIYGNKREYLQKYYITENPHPAGQKENLDQAEDGSLYSDFHADYHPWLRKFLRERGYYDIFIFDDNGNLIYSVYKELDYATNMHNGQWKDTDLAKSYKSAMNLGGLEEFSFYDFKPYPPSNNAPASFIAKPLKDGTGRNLGVLTYQMPIEKINEIMSDTTGLGDTGESFIVGQDYLVRNESRFTGDGKDTAILNKKIDIQQAEKALKGQEGIDLALDENNVESLIAYTPMEFSGVKYAFITKINSSEVFEPLYELRNSLLINALIVVLIVSAIGYFISYKLAGMINNLANVISKIASGNLVDIPYLDYNDEIGSIAKSSGTLKQAVADNLLMQKMTSDYPVIKTNKDFTVDFVNEAAAEELKKMGLSLEVIKDKNISSLHQTLGSNSKEYTFAANLPKTERLQIKDQWVDATINIIESENGFDGIYINIANVTAEVENEESIKKAQFQIQNLIDAAYNGDLEQRIDSEEFSGFYKDLANSLNGLMNSIVKPINVSIETIRALADGNLTAKMEGDFSGSFGEIQKAVNSTIDNLNNLVSKIIKAAGTVSSASAEISAGSSDLSQRTEEQASNLEETSASMEQMTSSVQENSDNADQAGKVAEDTRKIANQGGEAVSKTVESMSLIEESSQKIAEIVTVIDDIAFQTNLLALNAAVEAARAGEAGKGFAVVAEEVRALAGRSAASSKEIKELINESVDKVQDGVKVAQESGENLNNIIDSVNKLVELVVSISNATREQRQGIEEVNSAISQLDEMTQQNAAMVQQNTASAESLKMQASGLNEMMQYFNISNDNNSDPCLAANASKTKPSALSNMLIYDDANKASVDAYELSAQEKESLISAIKRAIQAHGEWKLKLNTAINTGNSEANPMDVAKDNLCEFGKWLYGEEMPESVKGSDDYENIRHLHAEFHRTASRVLDMALRDHKDEAKASMREGGEYHTVSTNLIRELAAWNTKVSAMKASNNNSSNITKVAVNEGWEEF
jgi:methyl-accepting chemotaxis protein